MTDHPFAYDKTVHAVAASGDAKLNKWSIIRKTFQMLIISTMGEVLNDLQGVQLISLRWGGASTQKRI